MNCFHVCMHPPGKKVTSEVRRIMGTSTPRLSYKYSKSFDGTFEWIHTNT